MSEKPQKTLTVRQRAYEKLRRMLVTGELKSGDRLSTPSLARQLGVSRTPVREAISRLASEGLIEETSGLGASVRVPPAKELAQLYDLRAILESYAAAEAARYITAEEIEQLDECCIRWLTIIRNIRHTSKKQLSPEQTQRWISIDEEFHHTIYSATKNDLLFKTLTDLRLLSRTLNLRRSEEHGTISLSETARTYRQHASLVRALRKGDALEASELMRQQIVEGKRLHLEQLGFEVEDETPRIVLARHAHRGTSPRA